MKLNKDIISTQYQKYLRIKKIFEAGDIYAIKSDIIARFTTFVTYVFVIFIMNCTEKIRIRVVF